MENNGITMAKVISKLNIQLDRGGYTKCPVCDAGKKKKRLNVNIQKGVFRCAACSTSGDGVSLYAWFKYGIDPEALKTKNAEGEEKERRREARKKVFAEINYGTQDYEPVPELFTASVDKEPPIADLVERDRTYSLMLNRLTLKPEHYQNLINRGLRRSDIIRNGYKSVPTDFEASANVVKQLRQEDAAVLTGVPGFLKKKDGGWALSRSKSGFYIPVRDISKDFSNTAFGKIQGLQIRYDTVGEGDQRYKWLSSRNFSPDKFIEGYAAQTYTHFVGYPEKEVLITEGPLKSDIINRFLDVPVLGVPGVNSIKWLTPHLEKLAGYGVRTYKICFDMDLYENINVRKALNNLIDLLKEKHLNVEFMQWDREYKGLDDYLLAVYLKSGHRLDM